MSSLSSIARTLVAPSKGILAADESTGTAGKRLASIGVENTEEHRRRYRQMLFTTSGLGEYISGVILYDETIRQKADDGRSFVEILQSHGVIPGIKVDMGTTPLPFSDGELVTEGLDGLDVRLKEYAALGAQFTKWRAVFSIDMTRGLPTPVCVDANVHALARYAAIVQEAGMVPIVEPEVLMDGLHSIEVCFDVTRQILIRLFDAFNHQGVALDGILLKPNMVVAGKSCPNQSSPERVAEMTLRCFADAVPSAVPGIVFLSGGQSEFEACANLNAINRLSALKPWQISFSFGRALQDSALKAWSGKEEQVASAQAVFLRRCRLTSAARSGLYKPEMEKLED